MRKRLLSFVLAVLMIATLLPVTALAYTTYYINGVAVRCDDFDSSPNECWTYANNIYNKIWGQQFNSLFDDSANSLRNLSDSELTLTAEHLRNYVSNAALGSALRICSSEYLHGGDGWGHSQIIVQKDSNGFTVLQGGLSASPYRNERYYTWSEYLNSWNYAYIKYIKWPGAPAYGGGTVTPDPDPGLSVKETITCKRTIKLPERVVNLYSNPTDTTRLTYFDYGPTVYSSRYAVMSDGSIMYEVGATNHQGQDIKVWLKYESDMTVTKQHTYGSTQYESAHPHRGYRVCECGDKTYTGETTTRDDCSECGGEVKYAVEGGYLTFDKKTGTVTDCDQSVTKANIPHTIKGVTVTCIGNDAFDNCRSLTSVTIPDSVMSIGDSAFRYCTSLTSVTIPDSVTSIGDTAFQYCTSLASVTIPDSVTSIGGRAFDGCASLTSVTIPDSVTSIGDWAFDGCTSLTSVTIPDSVTSIGDWAFDGCTSLTSVTIPDSVTSIGDWAFAYCKSLTSVTIPDSVTSIGGYAFAVCKSLTSVTIPDSVTSTGECTFSDCVSLTSVAIPDSVTCIDNGAFYGCRSLTSVTIPDGVTSIGRSAFSWCTSLTSVTIPDSVTSIGSGAFSNCAALTGIWVTEGNSHYSSDASGVLFSKDKTTLVQCPGTLAACTIPDSVTSIVGYAFDGCTSLTSVTIPDSVTSIGGRAFDGCTSLTSVTIPDSVTSIGKGAFYDCTSLTSVTIPDSVTSIDEHAFYDCKSLTSVTIPDSVTSIGDWAFSGCKSLTNVYFTGTEEAWNGITIDDGNDALKNANIHYNYVSHTHSYKAVVTAPTCTEKGYTTHTCSCGDSYVDTYTDALGHAWDNGKVTKEPTATETGVRTYTCTRCSATKTETIPATGSVDVTQMFTDVTKNWAYPGIQYCVTHGIMGGMGDGTFAPTGTTTRAQIVQILYNLEGTPAVSGTTPFTDLTANWYKPAILWAYQNNVVAGTSPTTFDPDQPVTREQIAVILTQYMFHVLKMERTWTPADLSKFPDGAQVSSWAKEAMQDAVALGLINGTKASDGKVYLDPQGSAARQQVATILMNFCQNVKK